MPCAGLRISHGKLRGLLAWRFVVHLPGTPASVAAGLAGANPGIGSVVANFVLDTGAQSCFISREVLTMLEYKGDMRVGQGLSLVVQGLEVPCVVAEEGEANRVSVDFLLAGSLSFYYDWKLDAPILYGQFAFCW